MTKSFLFINMQESNTAKIIDQIDENDPLILLCKELDWHDIEKIFSLFYSEFGRPSIPIRKMVGALILKRIFGFSDEEVVAHLKMNIYYQYFCGEVYIQKTTPFHPTTLTNFRKRIGVKGAEAILKMSIDIHPEVLKEKEAYIDTTVMEANITYPTDAKLLYKSLQLIRILLEKYHISYGQSYAFVGKSAYRQAQSTRGKDGPERAAKGKALLKKYVSRLVRVFRRKIDQSLLKIDQDTLERIEQLLKQEVSDKNKIYSLYCPDAKCIAKGKVGCRFEFGWKVSIVKAKKSGIIIGALCLEDNIHDIYTVAPQIEQMERLLGKLIKRLIGDRGYRGKKEINGVLISIPGKAKGTMTDYQKGKIREDFRGRAGIEPVIGHLKQDHRMERCYLKGHDGNVMNVLMSAAGYNMKKWMNMQSA